MRLTITEPASAHPRLPEAGEFARIFPGGGVHPLAALVVSVEQHGDDVTFVVETSGAAGLHFKGEPIQPQWGPQQPIGHVHDPVLGDVPVMGVVREADGETA